MSNRQRSAHGEQGQSRQDRRQGARASSWRYRKNSMFFLRLILMLVSLLILAVALYIFVSWMSDEPSTFSKDMQGFMENTVNTVSTGRLQDILPGGSTQPGKSTQPAATAQTEAPVPVSAQNVTEAQAVSQTEAPIVIQTDAPPAASAESDTILADADVMAAGYDYDGAIALVKTIPGYDTNEDAKKAVAEYEQAKAACVAVDVNTVPHIFYHSLLNDTDRAFNVQTLGQFAVDGMNAWMTTVDEFDKITQKLYDNGYVYVRLRDLVIETKNADGSVSFQPNTQLMLPPGKKAIVLSVDDLSYYHSYYTAGFPNKLVLDENGLVKCEYTDAAGNTTIGDYDVVPRLNTFLRQHPDGAYHGARGLIAMTGYNGVFGYRTDVDYEERAHLMEDQAAYLAQHPEFNRQDEIAQATVIADAIKKEGWEFASHTWGHLSVTGASVEKLRTDNEKWVANVQNIVGPVDTIIFAHGNDIGSWEGYSSDNEQYAYYKSAGYNFYCNVDGSVPYWVQIASEYVRQGRIDLDGYMLYQASNGQTSVLDNMVNASEVFDQRRPTPVVANGQG